MNTKMYYYLIIFANNFSLAYQDNKKMVALSIFCFCCKLFNRNIRTLFYCRSSNQSVKSCIFVRHLSLHLLLPVPVCESLLQKAVLELFAKGHEVALEFNLIFNSPRLQVGTNVLIIQLPKH